MSEDEFWRDDAEAIAQREKNRGAEHGGRRRFSQLSLAELEQELPGNAPRFVDPDPETDSKIGVFFMVAMAVAAVFGSMWVRSKWEPKSTVLEHFPALTAEQEKEFSDFTDECIRRGVLLKIRGGGQFADAYVLPPFYSLTVDQKTNFVRAWYGATFGLPSSAHERSRSLTVKDGMSGIELRTFDLQFRGMEWR